MTESLRPRRMSHLRLSVESARRRFWPALILWLLLPSGLNAQVAFEQPPINYGSARTVDCVARLQEQIDAGKVSLEYDSQHGYLKALLAHLSVSHSSQVLVFSKTSFQQRRIGPESPRALYFSDTVYLGVVPGGDVVEISTVDPNLGVNFYTLRQEVSDKPTFVRETSNCLQCHGSALTRDMPGHLVRSVYPDPSGYPILTAGSFLTDHTSPLHERWGGWYVTGEHGAQRHLGNLCVRTTDDVTRLDLAQGANKTDLKGLFDTSRYVASHSDIVALMVLEHQAMMHNLITRANYLTRVTLRDAELMNQMLERPKDYRSDSTVRRIQGAGEPVVECLLFRDEAALTAPIRGTTDFAGEFAARGPRDRARRSLRDFDLQRRMFRYPCSYLIYSEAFDGLPDAAKEYVYRRLWEVLSGSDDSERFRHLSHADREAILQILRDTKPGLPDYWCEADRSNTKAEPGAPTGVIP